MSPGHYWTSEQLTVPMKIIEDFTFGNLWSFAVSHWWEDSFSRCMLFFVHKKAFLSCFFLSSHPLTPFFCTYTQHYRFHSYRCMLPCNPTPLQAVLTPLINILETLQSKQKALISRSNLKRGSLPGQKGTEEEKINLFFWALGSAARRRLGTGLSTSWSWVVYRRVVLVFGFELKVFFLFWMK